MSASRYRKVGTVNNRQSFGTSTASPTLFFATQSGILAYTTKKLQGGERLDTIAFDVYGDSSYWWVIAGASGIGWSLRIPPGTLLRIPTDLSKVLQMVK